MEPVLCIVKIEEKRNKTLKELSSTDVELQMMSLSQYAYSNYLECGRYSRSFEELSHIGEGSRVFKVRHLLDQNVYAIKKVRIHLPIDTDLKKHQVYREI